jgi:hypothetical protein
LAKRWFDVDLMAPAKPIREFSIGPPEEWPMLSRLLDAPAPNFSKPATTRNSGPKSELLK